MIFHLHGCCSSAPFWFLFFKGKAKSFYVIFLPAAAFYLISQLEIGSSWQVHFFGFDLTLLRVDKLSKIFGYIFTLNAFAAFIYAFYLKDSAQHMSALFYIGSALGAVFAGDLISFYFYWEVMAVASTFLILARKTREGNGRRNAVHPCTYIRRTLSPGRDCHLYLEYRIG